MKLLYFQDNSMNPAFPEKTELQIRTWYHNYRAKMKLQHTAQVDAVAEHEKKTLVLMAQNESMIAEKDKQIATLTAQVDAAAEKDKQIATLMAQVDAHAKVVAENYLSDSGSAQVPQVLPCPCICSPC